MKDCFLFGFFSDNEEIANLSLFVLFTEYGEVYVAFWMCFEVLDKG